MWNDSKAFFIFRTSGKKQEVLRQKGDSLNNVPIIKKFQWQYYLYYVLSFKDECFTEAILPRFLYILRDFSTK